MQICQMSRVDPIFLPDPKMQSAALTAVGNLKPENQRAAVQRGIAALRKILKHEQEWYLRLIAANLLAGYSEYRREAVPVLATFLEEPLLHLLPEWPPETEPGERQSNLIHFIARMGQDAAGALPALRRIADSSKNQSVREAAEIAIAQITKK